jgi:hypothetical protein
MLYYIIIFISILIYLFFVLNSIIWFQQKKITNINDIIVKYLHYFDFILFSLLLLFFIYLYINKLSIKIS